MPFFFFWLSRQVRADYSTHKQPVACSLYDVYHVLYGNLSISRGIKTRASPENDPAEIFQWKAAPIGRKEVIDSILVARLTALLSVSVRKERELGLGEKSLDTNFTKGYLV